MTTIPIKAKDSASIIKALSGGVVPHAGIQHISVGRAEETKAIVESLNNVSSGNSEVRFWIGDYGSGKTFILQLIEALALKSNFVVSTVDFTPEIRLYANDGKALALYNQIVTKLVTQTSQDGNALAAILDQWIERIMNQVVEQRQIDFDALQEPENQSLVRNEIIKTTRDFASAGGFEFGQAIAKYYEGYANDDSGLKRSALRWLKGEYSAKTDARQDLGIRDIVNDQNYYGMLKNLSELFVTLGYRGFVVNLDEVENIYKIVQGDTRNKNYDKILSIYNDCLQGGAKHVFVNICGTVQNLENEQRGMFSYKALKTRLSGSQLETSQFRDLAQPVIRLAPLTSAEIFTLLSKLKTIFEQYQQTTINCDEASIVRFMEGHLNRPGASEFLTPREVIRDFIQLLSLLHQHPEATVDQLLTQLYGSTKPETGTPPPSIEVY
jgi:bacteriophage exclusion system BrxC/D-like protein